MIAERYNQEPHLVASIVLIGNIGSLIAILIVLAFVLYQHGRCQAMACLVHGSGSVGRASARFDYDLGTVLFDGGSPDAFDIGQLINTDKWAIGFAVVDNLFGLGRANTV